jgi:methionyl-tRNA formyltransferase
MELKDLNIVFMGTPEIAAVVLRKMLESQIKPMAVITRPDKPKGRGGQISESPVKVLALEKEIPVFQPLNKAELTEVTEELKPDLVIVAAFGMMLPEAVFETPKFKAINVHPSLLPLYRGPAPIEGPILNGDAKTGVTIMLISAGMDEGDILAQEEISLSGAETAPELEKKLADLGAKMLTEIIPKWVSGEIKAKKQDNAKATYTKLIKKEEGKIDWENETAEDIEKKSRAFQPWPGVFGFWNGKKLDFYDIEISGEKVKPGSVTEKDGKILIGTKTTAISPAQIKIEGKNKITAAEFLRGYPDFPGSKLN